MPIKINFGVYSAALLFLANNIDPVKGFAPILPVGYTSKIVNRSVVRVWMKPRDDSFDNEDSKFDLEAAREKLEALLVEGSGTVERESRVNNLVSSPTFALSPAMEVVLPPPPPLTTIERERRTAEIELLMRLVDGDDSLTDLWALWFDERGPEAGALLYRADDLIGQGPSSWVEAEEILQDLVDEHGVYWSEPVNRLATLYYMQGRMEEAEALCKIVLAVKPWHFGALSGIVMVYSEMSESENARMWAARRLPTFAPTGSNRRRATWVKRAIEDARESLRRAELQVLKSFGKPDDHVARKLRVDDETDAWQ